MVKTLVAKKSLVPSCFRGVPFITLARVKASTLVILIVAYGLVAEMAVEQIGYIPTENAYSNVLPPCVVATSFRSVFWQKTPFHLSPEFNSTQLEFPANV